MLMVGLPHTRNWSRIGWQKPGQPQNSHHSSHRIIMLFITEASASFFGSNNIITAVLFASSDTPQLSL
jgi:hypothetical protein